MPIQNQYIFVNSFTYGFILLALNDILIIKTLGGIP